MGGFCLNCGFFEVLDSFYWSSVTLDDVDLGPLNHSLKIETERTPHRMTFGFLCSTPPDSSPFQTTVIVAQRLTQVRVAIPP